MRFILRNITLYGFSLFILQMLFSGVLVKGGFFTYVLAGCILTVLFYTLRPMLKLLTFPINAATMGIFTVFINACILYVLVVLMPSISISSFVFPGISFLGFVIPKTAFSTFFAYVICAFVISCITTAISWLFNA